jgi:hypothetical protein
VLNSFLFSHRHDGCLEIESGKNNRIEMTGMTRNIGLRMNGGCKRNNRSGTYDFREKDKMASYMSAF